MADNCTSSAVEVEELTEDEAWSLFDREAHRDLGMSGKEFEEKWRSGELASSDDPNVTRVAMLLPSAW